MVPLSKQILVQENDFIRAGMPLSDGATTFRHFGYHGTNSCTGIYCKRSSGCIPPAGVKINDKHFEVIVRQMMRKVEVVDPGDTRFSNSSLLTNTR